MRMCWKFAGIGICGSWVVALLAWTGAASASVVIYNDRAAFEAALESRTVYGFETSEGFAPAPASLNTSPDGQLQGIGIHPFPVTARLLVRDDEQGLGGMEGYMGVAFRDPQTAVGLDVFFRGQAPPSAVQINFYFDSGIPPQVIHPFPDMGPGSFPVSTFVGIISTQPITGFGGIFPGGQEWGGLPGYGAVDNLTVGIVPEPAGLLMCLVPAVVVCLSRAKRR